MYCERVILWVSPSSSTMSISLPVATSTSGFVSMAVLKIEVNRELPPDEDEELAWSMVLWDVSIVTWFAAVLCWLVSIPGDPEIGWSGPCWLPSDATVSTSIPSMVVVLDLLSLLLMLVLLPSEEVLLSLPME